MSYLKFSSISNSSSPIDLRITILGKGVVGKSSLTYRFMNSEAPLEHDPTIEDKYKISISFNSQELTLELIDTAGEDDYQNMLDMWITNGDAFFLVFAINDEESFKFLEKKREKIIKMKGKNVPIVLIGNKKDLSEERKIEFSDAKALAKSWGVDYIETSAKNNINCNEALELIVMKLKNSGDKSIVSIKEKRKCCGCQIF